MTATLSPTFAGEIEVRFGNVRPGHSVYVRRRAAAAMIAVAVIIVLLFVVSRLVGDTVLADTVLADRGAVPASSPTIRPAQDATPHAQTNVAASMYVVQADDTLWGIAERYHGSTTVTEYVERLVERNGGTGLQIGQALNLP